MCAQVPTCRCVRLSGDENCCWVVNAVCPEQESASTTRLREGAHKRPHPACDGGVSLGLGDQVTQQGAGAEEAQADVGGLREVL